jgi:hypothetical protein
MPTDRRARRDRSDRSNRLALDIDQARQARVVRLLIT